MLGDRRVLDHLLSRWDCNQTPALGTPCSCSPFCMAVPRLLLQPGAQPHAPRENEKTFMRLCLPC